MGESSAIGWLSSDDGTKRGGTFNPVIGCSHDGTECQECYAEDYADERFCPAEAARTQSPLLKLWGPPDVTSRHITSKGTWSLPRKLNALGVKEGRRVRMFCASLSDVFERHDVWRKVWSGDGSGRRPLWEVLEELTHVDVLLLSKRTQNAPEYVPPHWMTPGGWPKHIIPGTTIGHPDRMDRVRNLVKLPAPRHFVSSEPLLGPLDLTPWLGCRCHPRSDGCAWCNNPNNVKLSWVIVGGESSTHNNNPRVRPMHPDWARSLRDQCAAAGVPFFFKQWGDWVPKDHAARRASPQDPVPIIHQWPDDAISYRIGKKRSGRLLDGVEHNGFYAPLEAA